MPPESNSIHTLQPPILELIQHSTTLCKCTLSCNPYIYNTRTIMLPIIQRAMDLYIHISTTYAPDVHKYIHWCTWFLCCVMLIHKHMMYAYIQLIRLLYVLTLTCRKKFSGCQQSTVYLQVSSVNVMHFLSVCVYKSMQSFPQKNKGWGMGRRNALYYAPEICTVAHHTLVAVV